MRGALATAFRDLHADTLRSNKAVNPSMLKRLMARWAPHLSAGFAQQDSQEFLRFLLDGLSEDLNGPSKSRKKPEDLTEEQLNNMVVVAQSEYVGGRGGFTGEGRHGTGLTLSLRRYWWERHLSLNGSIITSTFSGQLQSTITCGTCNTTS